METSVDGGEWLFPSFSLRHSHPFQLSYISFSIMWLMRTWCRAEAKARSSGNPWGCSNSTWEQFGLSSGRKWSECLQKQKGVRWMFLLQGRKSEMQDTHLCQQEFLWGPPTRYSFYLEKLISISSIAWLLCTDQSTFLSFPHKLGSSSRGEILSFSSIPSSCSSLALLGAC